MNLKHVKEFVESFRVAIVEEYEVPTTQVTKLYNAVTYALSKLTKENAGRVIEELINFITTESFKDEKPVVVLASSISTEVKEIPASKHMIDVINELNQGRKFNFCGAVLYKDGTDLVLEGKYDLKKVQEFSNGQNGRFNLADLTRLFPAGEVGQDSRIVISIIPANGFGQSQSEVEKKCKDLGKSLPTKENAGITLALTQFIEAFQEVYNDKDNTFGVGIRCSGFIACAVSYHGVYRRKHALSSDSIGAVALSPTN